MLILIPAPRREELSTLTRSLIAVPCEHLSRAFPTAHEQRKKSRYLERKVHTTSLVHVLVSVVAERRRTLGQASGWVGRIAQSGAATRVSLPNPSSRPRCQPLPRRRPCPCVQACSPKAGQTQNGTLPPRSIQTERRPSTKTEESASDLLEIFEALVEQGKGGTVGGTHQEQEGNLWLEASWSKRLDRSTIVNLTKFDLNQTDQTWKVNFVT